ncbi:uncharacterized protein LOC142577911 isoform X3 [Dermacentor variabilis]|uniref:uncharacterized protein LOC142577911 isoform X3 n=1 Tax=Dermacentor variabilis TaxID=34621 RepID=UPI003F5B422D
MARLSLYADSFFSMRGIYLLMCVMLVVNATPTNIRYVSCQTRRRECGKDQRPNCLIKNGHPIPFFKCSAKNRPCTYSWSKDCEDFTYMYCTQRENYCDCRCDVSAKSSPSYEHRQQHKQRIKRLPSQKRP